MTHIGNKQGKTSTVCKGTYLYGIKRKKKRITTYRPNKTDNIYVDDIYKNTFIKPPIYKKYIQPKYRS